MATESVRDRINHASASIDGVVSILEDMVDSDDHRVSRQAYAVADLMKRIGFELSELATRVDDRVEA